MGFGYLDIWIVGYLIFGFCVQMCIDNVNWDSIGYIVLTRESIVYEDGG